MENLVMVAIVLFFAMYIIYKKINSDNNTKSIKDKAEDYIKNAIFSENVLAQNNFSEKENIDKVYVHLNKDIKLLEKEKVIKNLFIDCAKFCNENLYESDNALKNSIFSAELALHIFSLWTSNKLTNYNTKEDKRNFLDGIKFQAYITCIKLFLNLIVKNIGQEEIDKDVVMSVVVSRVQQIFKENDMEVRNFNFLNICNLAIKYEEKTVFICGDFDNIPIAPSNPLDMMVLPLAYKTGLVDKYLQELEEAF